MHCHSNCGLVYYYYYYYYYCYYYYYYYYYYYVAPAAAAIPTGIIKTTTFSHGLPSTAALLQSSQALPNQPQQQHQPNDWWIEVYQTTDWIPSRQVHYQKSRWAQ